MTVRFVQAAERESALEFWFQEYPRRERREAVERVLRQSAGGEISLDGLLEWSEHGERQGMILAALPQDRAGYFWLPILSPGLNFDCQRQIQDELLQAALAWLQDRGAGLAQTLITTEQRSSLEMLRRNGLGRLAELGRLERNLRLPLPMEVPPYWQLQPYNPHDAESRRLFEETLAATFVGSLDCPLIRQRRTAAEVLAGHAAADGFSPAHWLLMSLQNRPAGLALWNDFPAELSRELVYLGVLPEFRGQRLGRQLTLRGLRQAVAEGCQRVSVCVDLANRPALDVYLRLGFFETSRQESYGLLFKS